MRTRCSVFWKDIDLYYRQKPSYSCPQELICLPPERLWGIGFQFPCKHIHRKSQKTPLSSQSSERPKGKRKIRQWCMFFLKTTELICWQSRRTRILTQSLGRPAGSRKQPSSGCLRIWWLLAISDIPWLIDASLSFLFLLPQGLLPSMYVYHLQLYPYKDVRHWTGNINSSTRASFCPIIFVYSLYSNTVILRDNKGFGFLTSFSMTLDI